MPRVCATGPHQGWQPDPHSPAIRKYINDGLDDENLGASPAVRNSPEDINEAQRIVDYVSKNGKLPKEVAGWRKDKGADKGARKDAGKQQDRIVQAVEKYKDGKLTLTQLRNIIREYNPVELIKQIPVTASLTDVVKALNTDKSGTKRILGLTNVKIKDGEVVSFRLDIPAYESYNVWVNTVRNIGEKQNYYSNIGVGNNAVFGAKSSAALRVATGTQKSPFAVINVAWENQNIEQTEQEIERALEDSKKPNSTWKQIGFNPNRSGYFYDKATFQPVASASRVLQLGPLVMAQNVQYVPAKEANVNFSPRPKIPDIPHEHFEYPNRKHRGGLTNKDLRGRFNRMLLDIMNDAGLKIASEKGIPYGIEWLEEFGKYDSYGGYWAADRDVIGISIVQTRAYGKRIEGDVERTALHEYGHMIMNRLLKMEVARLRSNPGSENYKQFLVLYNQMTYKDITDFNPEFKSALEADALALGLTDGGGLGTPFVTEKGEALLVQYVYDVDLRTGTNPPTYDGRLDGYYDIIDAMTKGYSSEEYQLFGHGYDYYQQEREDIEFLGDYILHETGANMFEAKYNKDQTAWNYMKENLPNLVQAFDNMMAKYDGQTKFINNEAEIVQNTHARNQNL